MHCSWSENHLPVFKLTRNIKTNPILTYDSSRIIKFDHVPEFHRNYLLTGDDPTALKILFEKAAQEIAGIKLGFYAISDGKNLFFFFNYSNERSIPKNIDIANKFLELLLNR